VEGGRLAAVLIRCGNRASRGMGGRLSEPQCQAFPRRGTREIVGAQLRARGGRAGRGQRCHHHRLNGSRASTNVQNKRRQPSKTPTLGYTIKPTRGARPWEFDI